MADVPGITVDPPIPAAGAPTPVDYNPFAPREAKPTPVDFDPFQQPNIAESLGAGAPDWMQPRSESMMDRLQHGSAVEKILGAMAKGTVDGFQPEQKVGFLPDTDATKFFEKIGFLYSRAGRESGPFSTVLDIPTRAGAAIGEVGLRTVSAGLYGAAGGIASAISQIFDQNEHQEGRGREEVKMWLEGLLAAAGAKGPSPIARMKQMPSGAVVREPVGRIPNVNDFADVASEASRLGTGLRDLEVAKGPVGEGFKKLAGEGANPTDLRAARAKAETEHAMSPAGVEDPSGYDSFRSTMETIPPATRDQFQVHGIANGETALEELLTKGIDPAREFHSGPPIGGTHGIDSTRTQTPYLIISDAGKSVRETGVKNVIVNGPAETNLPALRAAFPNVNFMSVEEGAAFIKSRGREVPAGLREAPPEIPATADQIAAKIRALWDEHGIHPAEVLADMRDDPALTRELSSDKPTLPERYTSYSPEAAKLEDLQAEARARGKEEPTRIEGISPQLSDALPPRHSWPERSLPEAAGKQETGRVGRVSRTLGQHVATVVDRIALNGWTLGDLVEAAQKKATPLASRDASITSRAAAKDTATTLRSIRYDTQQIFDRLTEEFQPEALRRMYSAINEEDMAALAGRKAGHEGLAGLSPTERAVTNAIRARLREVYTEAGRLKMHNDPVEGGRQFYVPRMISFFEELAGDEAAATQAYRGQRGLRGQASNALDAIGQEIKTRTAQLLRRKYKTLEETEYAVKALFGDEAYVVQDIRTMVIAERRLSEAIVGRQLIDKIKGVSELAEEGTKTKVRTGSIPVGEEKDYFTIPQSPAFWEKGPEFGPQGIVMKADGTPVTVRKPIFIDREYEGPLRAILTAKDGPIYSALMGIKSRSTSMIMLSPLLHNAVVFGRTMPSQIGSRNTFFGAPSITGIIPTARLYWEGNAIKNDPQMMRQAIADGLVPMSNRGAKMDIDSVTGHNTMEPGVSITAELAAAIPRLYDRGVGDNVALKVRAIQGTTGDFWHGTMLWDRVADLQAGLYKHYLDDAIARGIQPEAASKVAAHLANRYAGVLAPEDMSQIGRKFANLALFSRSFTLGNIGAMKDMFTGLPRGQLAVIENDMGIQEMLKARSYAQKKAGGIVLADIGLNIAGTAALTSIVALLVGDTTIPEEARGYLDRWNAALKSAWNNPMEVMAPKGFFKFLWAGSPTSQNEPSKEHKIPIGFQQDGTAIYAKNPTGKTGEDLENWVTHPAQTAYNKSSTLVKPLIDILQNRDYAGKPIYNPYSELPETELQSLGRMATHFMKAQVPWDMVSAGWELGTEPNLTRDEKITSMAKLLGPLAGIMVSKGYPGGPHMGVLAQGKREHAFEVSEAMPDIIKSIKRGDVGQAMELMDKVKIDPRLQKVYIDMAQNPDLRHLRKSMQKLLSTLPAEQQDAFQRHLDKVEKR